ncbi:hypothetical protein TYRP_009505 [Tyrophagus putrescentiae]|nr:hypothetical protein TYRP_009505 [Tyrophagus putrescentiae]
MSMLRLRLSRRRRYVYVYVYVYVYARLRLRSRYVYVWFSLVETKKLSDNRTTLTADEKSHVQNKKG